MDEFKVFCPKCRRPMEIRGQNPMFFGCSGYPGSCRYTISAEKARDQVQRRIERNKKKSGKRRRRNNPVDWVKETGKALDGLGREASQTDIMKELTTRNKRR